MPYQTVAVPADIRDRPRSQPEGMLRFNLAQLCVLMGEVHVTAPDACTYTDEGNIIPLGDPNYYLFVCPKRPIGAAAVTLNINGQDYGSGPKSGSVTIPALATFEAAGIVSGGDGWGSILTVTCSGGTANDWLDIWAVPDVDQFSRVRYCRSFDINHSPYMQPIADGFEPVRESINIRRGTSLSITRDYTDYGDGVHQIQGRTATLILELHPDGGPLITEYIIMANAFISAAQSAGDNAIVASTAEGGDRRALRYSPSG